MLIRLIGTVSIVENGEPVPIKAPKLAGVLAALATRPGTPVAQGELIERVWDTDPPATVFSVLYSYITRLRALLKRADPGLSIDRASRHGYTLNIAEDQIDIHLIRRLVAEATDLAGVDDHAALDRLRQACELAAGPVLPGVTGNWADAFRRGFHRERVRLLTDRYRMELLSGNHAEIVDELAEIVAAEETAEPLLATLMLAYYRCGRSAEALESFETARIRLRDELGADPSPELRRLHRQVLQQDPGLSLPGPARDISTSKPVPAQLPADTVAFTGRDAELAKLDELAQSDARAPLAALVGVGGVGKTAMAVHWAHANRHRFPDGQIYVNLRGYDRNDPVAPGEALGRLLSALGFSGSDIPDDVDTAGDLYRSATADRRMAVVLDNAREAAQVRPLLPGSGCFTIVTSRDRLTGLAVRDGAHLVRLGVFPVEQSTALLSRLLTGSDAAQALRLAELCGNLPLALRIAAARIAETPSAEVSGYTLELSRRNRLDLLSIPDDPDSAVAANLDLSFQRLTGSARALFCRLGTLPGEDFSRELVFAVSGLSEEETDSQLRQLVAAHLLEEHRRHRYRLHDLIRLYAEQRSEVGLAPEQRAGLIDEFIEWHHGRAFVASDVEETNILHAIRVLRDHPKLWRLVLPLRNTINTGRLLDQVSVAAQRGLERAELAADPMGVFRMTNLLSSVAYKQGASARAVQLGQQAITKAGHLTDVERGIAHGNLAIYQGTAADLAGSIELYEKAFQTLIPEEHHHALAMFYSGFLVTLTQVGRSADVEGHLAEFERACVATGAPADLARIRVCRAEALACLGRFDEALAEAESAVTIAQRHQHHVLGAWTLHRRGDILLRAGWPELSLRNNESEHHWGLSRGMTALLPNTMLQRAELMTHLGLHEGAMELLAQLRTERLANTPFSLPRMYLILAMAHNGLREPARAVEFAREAADRYAAMPWPARQEEALWALADAHVQLGDLDEARECLAAADAISSPANNGHRRHRRRTDPAEAGLGVGAVSDSDTGTESG